MKQVIIYTDGACRGNPGPGGWGALIKIDNAEKEIFGGQSNTTNNQMELTAAIEGFSKSFAFNFSTVVGEPLPSVISNLSPLILTVGVDPSST